MAIRIKLWADYGSYPIWGVDEIDNIAPEELPLSKETIDRLNAWQDAYDQTLNQDYPPLSGFPTLQAERDFKREAINLWKKLRLELAPEDYEVFYQNGSQLLKDPKNMPRKPKIQRKVSRLKRIKERVKERAVKKVTT
jgi:hypothetical protein